MGVIIKAISGFYYVYADGAIVACRARGKFRNQGVTPLVGDQVELSMITENTGILERILPRKNEFVRPAVANLDQLIILASAVTPVTEPFLIDRITAIADYKDVDSVICVNKTDIDPGDTLCEIYTAAGFQVMRTSAETGEGIDELGKKLKGKVSVLTGNSGVGKSSVLNQLEPGMNLKVGQVSEKLGRGRHTTRHIELFRLSSGAIVADTPGFSAFDSGHAEWTTKDQLQFAFREFAPYVEKCQFAGCSHTKEKGCAVLRALEEGKIHPSRHTGYLRLYEQLRDVRH